MIRWRTICGIVVLAMGLICASPAKGEGPRRSGAREHSRSSEKVRNVPAQPRGDLKTLLAAYLFAAFSKGLFLDTRPRWSAGVLTGEPLAPQDGAWLWHGNL